MYVLTADIKVGPYKAIKPAEMQWQHSVDSYANTASFTIPALCRLVRQGESYSNVNTAAQLAEGMPVQLYAGYNGQNRLVFDGYVSRIKYNVPLQVECEGYSYLLRKKIVNLGYASTTVKQLLNDLIAGTPIKLHPKTADVSLPALRFSRVAGTEVLEYLKKNMLTVTFYGDTLYAGIEQLPVTSENRYRLNWNTVGDDGLSFGPYQGTVVNIKLEKKKADGSRKRAAGPLKPGEKLKRVTADYTEAELKKLQDEQTQKEQLKGFEGSLTTFLIPTAEPGMTANITDGRYAERSGKYFIEEVSGSLGRSGGRQTLKLGRRL